MSDNEVLAIIPARGGSKGVPRKNVLEIGGKPMIAHTIEAALASRRIGKVIFSTEDEEIAGVARQWGAEVPFMRPAELAGDETRMIDVLEHALGWLRKESAYVPQWVLLLQPTSLLRTSDDIDGAIDLCLTKDADAVVSVCEVAHPPHWMHRIKEDGRLIDFIDTVYESRRQDMPVVYQRNGAIWLAKTEVLLENRSFFTPNTYAYVMDGGKSLEVDTELDLKVAYALLGRGN